MLPASDRDKVRPPLLTVDFAENLGNTANTGDSAPNGNEPFECVGHLLFGILELSCSLPICDQLTLLLLLENQQSHRAMALNDLGPCSAQNSRLFRQGARRASRHDRSIVWQYPIDRRFVLSKPRRSPDPAPPNVRGKRFCRSTEVHPPRGHHEE